MLSIDARFIYKDQILGVDPRYVLAILPPLLLDLFLILLCGAERFFLRVSFSRCNTRWTVAVLTATRCRRFSCLHNSFRVASGVFSTSRRTPLSAAPWILGGLPPPCGFGSTRPV